MNALAAGFSRGGFKFKLRRKKMDGKFFVIKFSSFFHEPFRKKKEKKHAKISISCHSSPFLFTLT